MNYKLTKRAFICFSLEQNYQNPFNPETSISYELRAAGHVNLSIFNLRGERVMTLVNAKQPAGKYSVRWRAKDAAGKSLASGIHWYRLEVAEMTETRKMILEIAPPATVVESRTKARQRLRQSAFCFRASSMTKDLTTKCSKVILSPFQKGKFWRKPEDARLPDR